MIFYKIYLFTLKITCVDPLDPLLAGHFCEEGVPQVQCW